MEMICKMIYQTIQLKNYYDFLGENEANPTVQMYLPYNMHELNRENQKRPCLVVCPGGAYYMCSERESEPIALKFLSQGFNVFVLTYSTLGYRFPTQIREVAALMELIYANADNWNCDTSKISIIGFSAGGHLAAHYSTMFDCKEVREVFPESKAVNASILAYPVITAEENNCHMASFKNLVGHYPLTEEEMNYFSCERCVKENTPPTFIWHTASDEAVPVVSSLCYATALSQQKIPFELHIYPFGQHGLSACDHETVDNVNENVAHANAWMTDVFKWLKLMNLA